MNVILLSGGSGQRLWPLSNDIRSKQFIEILKENDTYISMIQNMYNRIMKIDHNAVVTIATSDAQVPVLKNQLGSNVSLSIEPCRRDTFPAIVLATTYIHDVKKVDEDDVVIVCPVDPYIEDDYFEALKILADEAKKDDANLTLMGIEPTEPSEKYGYIIPSDNANVSKVLSFKEKPSRDIARQYIEEGALWNCGVFAYKVGYLLEKAHEMITFNDYYDLFDKYNELEKISFDYAVVEKENSINVIRFGGMWKDLGTWDSLVEILQEKIIGNGIQDDKCKNTKIVNQLEIPIVCLGTEEIVVAASKQGILVSQTKELVDVKKYIENLDAKIMFAEEEWGQYEVIHSTNNSVTKKCIIKEGKTLNLTCPQGEKFIITFLSANAKIIINNHEDSVYVGSVFVVNSGDNCIVTANDSVELIETQIDEENVYEQ